MRIKKLEIFGFKSFATKQFILFGEGITAVVGPNGCGKSNVVDALRWVMGEQNPHRLRGGSMQDIIFCGSDKKAALGFAEVTLTIENNKSDAPLEYNNFNEIEICRRLYKTGESEYLINKQKARLKDIADFFLGTGVGSKAYSIIEQGRVNDMISAKPQDRRLIIEEAAGISKYKAKKAYAEKRMEACRSNLDRIIDIKNELDHRLSSLAKEKEKLAKVKSIKQRIKDIDLHESCHDYLYHLSLLRFAEANKYLLQEKLLTNERDLAFLEHSFNKILNKYHIKNNDKILLNDLANQHQNTLQLLNKDMIFIKSTYDNNNNLISRLQNQLDDIDIRYQELNNDILSFTKDMKDISLTKEEIDNLFLSKKTSGNHIIEERKTYITKEQDIQKKILATVTEASKLQTEINILKKQDTERTNDIKKITDHLSQKENELNETKKHAIILQKEYENLTERKTFLIDRKNDISLEIKNNNEIYQQSKKELIQNKNTYLTLTAKYSSLKDIDDKLSWTESGIASLMTSKHAHLVKYIVANSIIAKPGHEEEVEKCLGHLLDAAIISNHQDLLTITDALKNIKASSATLYVINPNYEQISISRPLGLVCLNDLITINHQECQGFKALCSKYFIAPNFGEALSHWPAARLSQATIVSLSKEVLLPDGRAIILGDKNNQGVLKRKNDILQLEQDIKFKQEEIAKLEKSNQELSLKHNTYHQEYEAISSELTSLNITLVRLEEKLQQKDIINLEELIKNLKHNSKLIKEKQSNFNDEIKELNDLCIKTLAHHSELEAELDQQQKLKKLVDESYESFNQELKSLEIKKAALNEKLSNLKQNIEQAKKSKEHLFKQKEAFLSQIEEKASEEIKLKERERQIIIAIENLDKELKKTKIMLENITKELANISQDKTSQEIAFNELKSAKQNLVNLLHEDELSIQNYLHNINKLCEKIYERYRIHLADVIYDYHQTPLHKEQSKKESHDLKKSLERMGPVNENAQHEYDEIYQRSHFLHNQVNDLYEALNQLDAAIKKINKTTKLRFMEAFKSINEKFSLVFPRLFNGGKAELVLINEEDLLNCGIDIMARPPGKHISSIELMSGGEKALTAISLIMAIFLIKPSPFCLLDEVDAPLDETNVVRFNQLIKEISRLSQFIVITHNKKTMETSDQLYGVTMEDAGQSKIVTVHVKEALNHELIL